MLTCRGGCVPAAGPSAAAVGTYPRAAGFRFGQGCVQGPWTPRPLTRRDVMCPVCSVRLSHGEAGAVARLSPIRWVVYGCVQGYSSQCATRGVARDWPTRAVRHHPRLLPFRKCQPAQGTRRANSNDSSKGAALRTEVSQDMACCLL